MSATRMKLFQARPLHLLRYSIEGEFAIQAWHAELGLGRNPEDTAPLYNPLDWSVSSSTGASCQMRMYGKYEDGRKATHLSKPEALQSFPLLQLDVLHAM